MEGDRTTDRVIVYCSSIHIEGCRGGVPVIPPHGPDVEHEYVNKTLTTQGSILVKTRIVSSQKYRYWLMINADDIAIDNCNWENTNCDSIISSHIIGPYSSLSEFNEVLVKQNIPERLD